MRRLVSEGTRLAPSVGAARRVARRAPRARARAPRAAEGRSRPRWSGAASRTTSTTWARCIPTCSTQTCAAWLEDASARAPRARRARAAQRGEARAMPARCGCSATAKKPSVARRGRSLRAARGCAIGGRVAMTFALRSRSRDAAGPARRRGRALREGARRRRAKVFKVKRA